MTDDEQKDPIVELSAKLDAVMERVEKLEQPVEPEAKEDAEVPVDPRITKAEGLIRGLLKDNLPSEKLDSMGLDALMLAHDLRSSMKIERSKPSPPSGVKEDATEDLFKYSRKSEEAKI